ncbi:MAG: secondary thiamine-phosphate synthase enzyme YjbQ [Deltaproteobacteria bacterium]|nr:secondary thiamine-phosphate synthase enzyme YjbQ [Deltaproteobacteria bacterium]
MIHAAFIELSTKGFTDIVNITEEIKSILSSSSIRNGQMCIFVPGSTGSVTTIEFEDGVLSDLREAIETLVPKDKEYKHDKRWGDGNGFSHIRAALMKPGLTIPIIDRHLTLGTWQQLVFIDFDNKSRSRSIVVQITGE